MSSTETPKNCVDCARTCGFAGSNEPDGACEYHNPDAMAPREPAVGAIYAARLARAYPEDDVPANLDELLEALRADDPDVWEDLPTFGGEEPASTCNVWSWDATRMIVGLSADDVEIIPR